jgi:transcriptional regulator with XRE-family HTH domain
MMGAIRNTLEQHKFMSEDQKWNDRLRERLSELGMTQKEFAEVIGISPSRLTHYVNGIREPSVELLAKIIRESGVTADWLILGLRNKSTIVQRNHSRIAAKFDALHAKDKKRIEAAIDVFLMTAKE